MENSAVSAPLPRALNMAHLKMVLEQDASSINEPDFKGNALLHRVLDDPECSVDIVTLLLHYGANINLENNFGHCPLFFAFANCTKEVIELLLNKGALLTNTWVLTPLHLVLGFRNKQKGIKCILKLLLDRGADVNARNCLGQTPLCHALQGHEVDITNMLLDAGAQMTACHCHVSPFHCCMDNFGSFKVDVLKLLLNIGTAHMNIVNTRGETPLCIALLRNKIDVIQLLIDAGANINGCAKHVSSLHCYMYAYYCIKLSVLKLLMSNGDDMNKVNDEGQTPLCIAYSTQNTDSIKRLLNVGANINGCKYHISPVYCYVTQSHSIEVGMIKLFVDAGVDIHEVDNHGNIPLLLALKNCECEISAIMLLLNHKGGDINVRNTSGESVLHCALQNELFCKSSIIKFLIRRGAQIDAVTENGDIPLHDALKNLACGPDVIKTLLDKGSPINLVNKFGRTPLGNVQFGFYNHDALKVFLAAGARIKGANSDHELPILQQVLKVYGLKKCNQNLKYLKTFLKYSFLEGSDSDIEGLIQGHKDYETFSSFAKMCACELREMESENVGPDFTLREFLEIHMYTGEFTQQAKYYDFNQLLKILAKKKYPLYLEVVLAKVGRSRIIDKLQEIPIYTNISEPDFPSVRSKIVLDSLTTDYIAQYLSENDLLNVILAFCKSPKTLL